MAFLRRNAGEVLRGTAVAGRAAMHHRVIALTSVLSICAANAAAQQAQTQPAQAPQTPIQRPNPVPATSQRLPQWLRVGVEHRGRLEGPMNASFDQSRDDAYWLNRFRVDVDVRTSRLLSFHVQGQDAQVWGRNAKPDAPPFEDTFDLRMAYAEIGEAGKSPLVVRAGRQEMFFGEQRLVGHVSWSNTARAFDGVRAMVARPAFRLDGFVTSLVAVREGEFNRSGQGEAFHGLYAALPKLVPSAVVEPYVLVKHVESLVPESGGRGDLTSTTVGTRFVGKLPARFDYNTEIVLQRGSLVSDSIRAWAGHWVLGRTLVPQSSLRVAAEYNYASGDRHNADGVRGTFDQLYPTPHDKYGLSDQIGWRNVHHARAGVEMKPTPKLTLGAGYHSWWRASITDNVYSAPGGILVRPVAGVTATHIGQELDVQGTYTLMPRVQIHGGYAHIIPGAYLEAATPGKNYSFPYVMVTSTILKASK